MKTDVRVDQTKSRLAYRVRSAVSYCHLPEAWVVLSNMATGDGDASFDIEQTMERYEKQELEAPGGVATPEVYSQLLGLYLLQNDMNNAKYLWKRIPEPIKTVNPELGLMWGVGQKMWQRDFPGMYAALNKDWSERIKPTMSAILEAVRLRAVRLVGQSYSSISFQDFAEFVGLPMDQAVSIAITEGWQTDSNTNMVLPRRPELEVAVAVPSEQQLGQLTQYVSFLENQ